MSTLQTLIKVQLELKAPKSQRNNFGNYNYRSCEDILEAVKPINGSYGATVLLTDEIVNIGTKNYVKATARFITEEGEISVTAYAREAEDKKGMDDSQITGATSSYARKYALNGLYDIDDTKDADATNDHGKKNETMKDDKPKIDINKPVNLTPKPTPKPEEAKVDTDSLPFGEGDNRISKAKLDYITGIIRTLSVERVMKFNEWLEKTYKCRSVNELTDNQATSVIAQLTRKP